MTTAPRSSTAAADALIDPRHPFAAHLRHVAAAEAAEPHREWTPEDGPLPALYLSHGAPPTFEDGPWMRQLHDWARALPRPRAVLIVSAHWESDALGITSTAPTELVYDFGGFAPMYYRMRYDTPDPSALAQQVLAVLPAGQHVHEHRSRGLDHGAWLPLKVMYPDAGIPVLQLSLPTHDTTALLGLGRRLRTLREQGVLVVGSGFMTHGLPFVDWSRPDVVPGWSADFDAWAADALDRGDVEELARFRLRAPGLRYAHPTVEHFTPLFVTLGAATDPTAPVTTAIDGFTMGLAKRSFQVA
ncbi:class III extradiol ring-cleavage dioxygenase [Blastococcus sp. TF02A_35]|uniref:dioxygenase family protein n=1 Tax=Blastococcus sp. TF02A-35 TaxID=2559612 RepID=UPI001074459A|nr:class III extradiol ring-cleavage dioxygenase [Blastococcus sp. TF02A_35]TFV49558.1 dioxygenase [Blastococcus sp. TF02A_35]